MKKRQAIAVEDMRQKVLLLGVHTPHCQIQDIDAYYEEFLSLVHTLGITYDETLCMKIRMEDTSHFLTKGKMAEVAQVCQQGEIDQIICSQSLSPLQERNLSSALNCTVYDRTYLILEIFNNAAHSSEGKIQVQIAKLEYLKTRLAGRGKDLAQQAGYIGTRGPGETEKEALKRYYATKIRHAQKKLGVLKQTRNVQRKQRLESNLPLISLVGYTNAGKSSLLNILTKSEVLVEDKLFATVDTTTRTLFLESGKKALISDTVGFISELPHHLIDAFRSTLDELAFAELILLIIDSSSPLWQDHIAVVEDTLSDLGIDQPVLYVFNKKDTIDPEAGEQALFEIYSPNVFTDTRSKEGIEDLIAYLRRTF